MPTAETSPPHDDELDLLDLLVVLAENLKLQSIEADFMIPYSDTAIVSKLHEAGTVLEQEYLAEGTLLKVRMEAEQVAEFEEYLKK